MTRWRLGLALAGAAALAPLAAHADAANLFYERAVMTAADQRCNLFKPEVGSALAAGRAQARGAALRSGVTEAALRRIDGQARSKAYSVSCQSPDIATAAGRVKAAFEPWSHLTLQAYSGDFAGWTAVRSITVRTPVWALSQPTKLGKDRMTFGWASVNGKRALLAVAALKDKDGAPYTARIVMRDPARAEQAYLDKGRLDSKGRIPLAGRVTPHSASRSFIAEAKTMVDERLAPRGEKNALAFRFPAAAAAALAELDPREAIEVQFIYSGRDGETVKRALIEVGDFAAGQAFIDVPQR